MEKNISLNTESKILLTGAAGFIGSCMLSFLNKIGFENIYLLDDFSNTSKLNNWKDKSFLEAMDRSFVFNGDLPEDIECIIHLGAKTDTTLFDQAVFDFLNIDYSKFLWKVASERNIPFIYASSAATYGDGKQGFSDQQDISNLKPLNPYGQSKQDFDVWALEQSETPPNWYGLKFFNVYGPNEYHKGRMASVIFHFYNQIQKEGSMRLFRSHHPDYKDGEQLRDFIYVQDLLEMISFFMEEKPASGLYNIGTGKARTFLDLANTVFETLGKTPQIDFIDTPEDIRDKYQYFTEAEMQKLKVAGYSKATYSLEEGVKDYIENYLSKGVYY